jgi:hypothetical protein
MDLGRSYTRPAACSLGLSATSQQYFSLRTNQPPATSRNQPAVIFSQNKPAPAISHQPTEQAAVCSLCSDDISDLVFAKKFSDLSASRRLKNY